MAHKQKYTMGNMRGLSIHLERKTDNHSNPDIDNSRSTLNYDLCNKEGDTLSRLQKRLNEVDVFKRKDVNVCVDWIVTLPESLKNMSESDKRSFFEKTYDFLEKRYGGLKNVVSAHVHMDETTPHMHFTFVPTVVSPKTGREKVHAKSVVDRKDLQTFHKNLDSYLKEQLPEIYKGGIINNKTMGIETVKEIKELDQQIITARSERSKKLKALHRYQEPLEELKALKWNAKRSISGKLQLSEEEWNKIEVLVQQGNKMKIAFYEKGETLEKEITNLKKKNNSLERMYQETNKEKLYYKDELNLRNKEFDMIENKYDDLEQHTKDNSLVYRNILNENHINSKVVIEMNEVEWSARSVIQDIRENGVPKNKKTMQSWLNILEKAKEKNLLIEGLQLCIDLLTKGITKVIEKTRRISR